MATPTEIRFGIEILPDPSQRAGLNEWLTHKIRLIFEQRVLAIIEAVLFKWQLMVEKGGETGHLFSQPDLIIAATGFHHGLTIVTRDVTHYAWVNIPVFSP